MPRLAGGRSVTSRPASRTVPDAGRTKPASALSAVDLPDPLGPSSATVSPAATRKLKSINAFVALQPRPYETPTRSNVIAGVWVSIGSACRVVARGRPTPTRFMPRLPLAPVLARASLRSSLAPAFGAHASAPARSGPRSCLAAILTRARLRAVTSVPRRLLVCGQVGIEFGEHGVPVRHPHLDAVEHCCRRVRCIRTGSGGADLVAHRDAERIGLDRLLDIIGQQVVQQLLGRGLVRRTLGN